jgi:hypothetical protein
MDTITRRISPDGKLALAVVRGEAGEIAVGFEGGDWHTHPNILAGWLNVGEEQAVGDFIARLERDELPIIWSTDGGQTVDPWVSDNLEATVAAYGEHNTILRSWSGAPVVWRA